MSSSGRRTWGSVLTLTLGLAVLLAVASRQDFERLGDAFGRAGWKLLFLSPVFLGPLLLSTFAWGRLIPERSRPAWTRLIYARWVGFGMNQLLPVAQIGGDALRVRLALRSPRASASSIVASVVADKTAQVASIAIVGTIGLLLWPGRDLRGSGLLGVALLASAGVLFYVAQRRGLLRWSAGWVTPFLPEPRRSTWASGANSAAQALEAIYRERKFGVSVGFQVFFRIALAAEVWLLAGWFDNPVTVREALVLESMNQVLRAAAFVVPGALGAQEAVFVIVGSYLSIPSPIAFALSLGKRVRELMVGVPALLTWQLEEAVQAGKAADSGSTPRVE